MKKNTLVFLLTAILFFASVVLGVTTVYRIDTVYLQPVIISQEAEKELEELHKRLLQAYDKQSFFSVQEKQAKEILSEFPYFHLTSFDKSYPNRIVVKVAEYEEVYALPTATNTAYYILGSDGTVLGLRETYINRLDGENNLLITGLEVTGERGGTLSGDELFLPVLTFCQTLCNKLERIRRNVVSVEVLKMTETIVKITMREGVKIYVGNIENLTVEKAEKATEVYLGLSDEQRLTGRIAVSDEKGKLIVGYAQKDEFEF